MKLEKVDVVNLFTRYLNHEVSADSLYNTIRAILDEHLGDPDDPRDRPLYCLRSILPHLHSIVNMNYLDEVPNFRRHLARWIDALGRSDEDWDRIIERTGGLPLAENVPDWDR
jgi:hypothetical protein